MNADKLLEIIKTPYYIVPSYLIKNYTYLNLTSEEVIFLILIINKGDKVLYDLNYFIEQLNIEKFKLMQLISGLEEKKIITIDVMKNDKNQNEEYINLELLYSKIANIYLSDKKVIEEDSSDIYSAFENELGRTLSPMEYEIIKGWLMDKFTNELIILALKEAVYNGVNNLRYIDKVLYEWRKKNLKNKEDIFKDKEKYRKSKKDNVEVFDYNWLDE